MKRKKRKKTKKEKKRTKIWSKRICLKEHQYEFIKQQQEEFNYKTLAGTLDKIINSYKENV